MPAYSFLDVNATLVGVGAVIDLGAGSGNAEEGITIAAAGDKNTMLIGADGEGMHSLHADKSGTVTVRLLKVSKANAKLMALYDAQSLSSAAWGQNVITVTHSTSGDVTACRSCAFKKRPDMSYKKDGDIIEWVFDALKIDTILGTY
ncbi:phage structural protein [Pseudomonas tohonis]|uniref:phage structural protein n=1 Tax=Pseudomonas tohonis TaxID=2725477 RepID=UPI001F16A40A|nr:phage protein [Pseudomonas tohonis]